MTTTGTLFGALDAAASALEGAMRANESAAPEALRLRRVAQAALMRSRAMVREYEAECRLLVVRADSTVERMEAVLAEANPDMALVLWRNMDVGPFDR